MCRLVALHWPDFYSIDSALFVRKNKHVPTLPKKIEDLKDLPDHYKQTKQQQRFLASPVSMFKCFITFASLAGLNILYDLGNQIDNRKV